MKSLPSILWMIVMLGGLHAVRAQTTNTWQGSGNASEAANWTLGEPQSTHHIRLDATSVDNLTWDAGVNGLPDSVASWTQTAAYTGTSTFETVYGDTGFTVMTIGGDAILAGGAWTHIDANTSAETYRLNVAVQGDVHLSGDARIDVDFRGFNGGQGPGQRTGGWDGAGHGGLGANDGEITSATHGDFREPIDLGSGGGGSGPGGGAIRLIVAGETTVEAGTWIGANGHDERGAGAGGSIHIETQSIAGAGTIRANGGEGTSNRQYGGGGGRAAIVLTGQGETFAAFTNAAVVSAFGGSGDHGHGAAGTVYLQEGNDAPGAGTLIIDNSNLTATEGCATLLPPDQDLGGLSAIVIRNNGNLGIRDPETPLDYGTLPFVFSGVEASAVRIAGSANITWPDPLVVEDYTLIADGLTNVLSNVRVGGAAPGAIVHPGNYDARTWRLDLALSGDLTVASNGWINADARGFDGTAGPGSGGGSWRGGSHGGMGHHGSAAFESSTYGSIRMPVALGSRGSSGTARGGGAVRLAVTGDTLIEEGGRISAEGMLGRATGAGGSVWIETSTLDGAGLISADGGSGNPQANNRRYGGGGGRVAIRLTDALATLSTFSGTVRAHGGGGDNNRHGAAGTVYIEAGDGTAQLIIDNTTRTVDSSNTDVLTELPPSYDGTDLGYVFDDDLSAVALHVIPNARIRLTGELAIKSLAIEAGALLDLNGHTLYMRGPLIIDGTPHPERGELPASALGDDIVDSDPNELGRIIIPPPGSVFLVR